MTANEVTPVDGVEWCCVHHGILDECGPDRTTLILGDDEADTIEFQACDNYCPGDDPCDVRPLFYGAAS